MYEQLKDLMGYASFFYGPTSKEVAFSTPVQSWTTTLNGQWYIGTTQPVEALNGILIPVPADAVVEGQTADAAVTEEQPAEDTQSPAV